MTRRYRLIAHTADIGLNAYGATLAEAFASAACGMFSIMTDLRRVRAIETRRVELEGEGYEALLFRWLNSLLYHFDVENLLLSRFEVVLLNGRSLRATCHGERYNPSRHRLRLGVKSATYHMMDIDPKKNQVRVIFDV